MAIVSSVGFRASRESRNFCVIYNVIFGNILSLYVLGSTQARRDNESYRIFAKKTILMFAPPNLTWVFCCDHLTLVLKRLKGKQDVLYNGT